MTEEIEIETNEGIVLGVPSDSGKTVKVVTPDGEHYQLDTDELRKGTTLKRENGDRYFRLPNMREEEKGKVCVTLDKGDVCVHVPDKPTDAENIKALARNVINARDEVKSMMNGAGGLGHASMNVSGNSEFVREVKKNGGQKGTKKYKLGEVRISYSDYEGGYNVYLDYNSRDVTETQSTKFKASMLELFNQGLAELGLIEEPVYVSTRVS